jgi:hypothetical protein
VLLSACCGRRLQCILEHFCVCSGGRVFDGVECADGAAWVKETQVCVNRTQAYVNRTQAYVNRTQVCVQLSAPAGLPAAGGRVSLPHELVSMPGTHTPLTPLPCHHLHHVYDESTPTAPHCL